MRKVALGRDWTKGSIVGNLLALAWPIVISQSLRQAGFVADMIYVGRLGAASIAGVGVSSLIISLVAALMRGFTNGVRALVARFVGAGNTEGANHVIRQAFVINVVFSAIMAVIGIFLSRPMLILFGLEASAAAEGAAYMRIMFIGSLAVSFFLMIEGVLQASGDAVTPMRISAFVRIFHVVLDPFLIFGLLFFPRLGVSGAALSNVIADTIGVAFGLWVLLSGQSRLRLVLDNFRLDAKVIWRIVKIAAPSSFSDMEWSLANLVFMWILIPFGTLAVAAESLVARIDNIVRLAPRGLGYSSGILAGQNLGAGQPQRAAKTGWLAASAVEILMFTAGAAILVWPEKVISIFSTEPALMGVAIVFVRIAVVGYLMLGFSTGLKFCINGVGDTMPTMLIVVIGMWVFTLPMAYALSRFTFLGVYGIPWGTVIGEFTMATAITIYFKIGRWQRKKV